MSIAPRIVIMPPCHRTTASAAEAANAVVDIKRLRKCISFTLSRFMTPVKPRNSRSIFSSITSVFVVFAPVMPSLKPEVILEFCSRTLRWWNTSFFWK